MYKSILDLITNKRIDQTGFIYLRPKNVFLKRIFDFCIEKEFKKHSDKSEHILISDFKTTIDFLTENYQIENKPFVVNIRKGYYLDIQIINRIQKYQGSRNEFGFVIFLNFDIDNFSRERELYKNFLSSKLYKKFKKEKKIEGNYIYSFDCENDSSIVLSMLNDILLRIFKYSLDDRFYVTTYDGKLNNH